MSYFNRDMFLSKDKKNACTKRLARLCREILTSMNIEW